MRSEIVKSFETWNLPSWLVPDYWLFCRYPAPIFLDSATPALALGLFFGRIGCFLAGCNGGIVSDLPWRISFPRSTSTFGTAFIALPARPSAAMLGACTHLESLPSLSSSRSWSSLWRFGGSSCARLIFRESIVRESKRPD